jgi:hypothetical protein
VLQAQRAQLAHPQAQRVGTAQGGARLETARAGQQPRDLLAREDLGQPLRTARQRRAVGQFGVPEHLAEQEVDRAAGLVDGGARELPLAQQMHEVGLDLLATQEVGTAPVVARQLRDGRDVGLLRARGLAVQDQRIEHASP